MSRCSPASDRVPLTGLRRRAGGDRGPSRSWGGGAIGRPGYLAHGVARRRNRMRRILLMTSVLALLLVSGSASVHGATSTGTFQWEAGAGVVCGVEEAACPDVAMASNGDTVTIRAQGNMNAGTGSASGGGSFEHRNAAGTLLGSGTLTATRLIAFQFWGCDGFGLPSNLCGGRAELAVHLVGHPASDPSATIELD